MLTPSLTLEEKRVVKALLNSGDRNQDIHALINTGREPTVNFGRISTVKKSKIEPATEAEVAKFKLERSLTDLKTGLAPFRDERLVRAREAMLLAVNVFNMPLLRFKVEVFSVLSNIAWTYLLHEFYDRRGVKIVNDDGNSLLLSQMLKRPDFPLTKGAADNLRAMKIIRDEVERRILNSFAQSFYSIFQANCLNFERAVSSLFSSKLSLGGELQYALQFSTLSMDQAVATQGFDMEGPVKAIDAKLAEVFSEDEMSDPQFRFKVTYSLEKASKSDAHFSFSNKLGEGGALHNVLIQKIPADENWPHKPNLVVKLVAQKTGKKFTSHNHTQAWRKFGVRPRWDAEKPEATNKKYCTYHPAHKDYTYSEDWVVRLTEVVNDAQEFASLTSFKT